MSDLVVGVPPETRRFPAPLLLPVALSSTAVALLGHAAPWAVAVLGTGLLVRVVLLVVGADPRPSRFGLAAAVSLPSVATAWVAVEAGRGIAVGPALVSVATALLGLLLASPTSGLATAGLVGISLAQVVGATLLAPGPVASWLAVGYVGLLVVVLPRATLAGSLPSRPGGSATSRRVVSGETDARRGLRVAPRLLAIALPIGLWTFLALPHRGAEHGRAGGVASARGSTDDPAASGARERDTAGASSFSSFVSGGKTSMRLGFVAQVRTSERPVLLVEVDGGAKGPADPITLRGFVYDVFSGREWSRSAGRAAATIAPPDADGWSTFRPRRDPERTHLYRILDVAGDDAARLFLVPEPVRVRIDAPAPDRRVGTAPDGLVTALRALPRGASYEEEAEVAPDDARSATGRRSDAMTTPFPHLLDAPPEAERYREIARAIVGDATDPASRAERIEAHLRSAFGYTTRMPEPDPRRPVLDFLERIRRGHCEYFASAMTLLMRSLGHPARLAVGFRGGEWLESVRRWSFRGSHAHAWCEVFHAGVGFVRYDPTPADDDRLRAGTRAANEEDEPGLFARLLRLDAADRDALLRGAWGALGDVGATISGVGRAGPWPPILGLLALGALALRRRRRVARSLGGVDGAGRPLGPYGAALAALAGVGLARGAAESAVEHARRVARTVPETVAPLRALVDLHDAARFGGRAPSTDDLARATTAAHGVVRACRGAGTAPDAAASPVPTE